MKLTKITAAVLAAVMSLAMLTACGGGGGSSGSGNKNTGSVITTKQIEAKDSNTKKVLGTGQIYFEMPYSEHGITETIKVAQKGNNSYYGTFVGSNKIHWEDQIQTGTVVYDVIYPDHMDYDYYDENGKELTCPVYSVETTTAEVNKVFEGWDDDTIINVGPYTMNGKTYYAESYTDTKGETRTYCYDTNNHSKFVGLVVRESGKRAEEYPVSNFSNTGVSDNYFVLPSNAVNVNETYSR